MGTEPAIIAHRLGMAEWLGWLPPERDAIREVFGAAWRQSINEHPDDTDAVDWLCGIAAGDMNLAAAIEVWDKAPTANSVLQLSSFIRIAAKLICEPKPEERGHWSYANDANIAFLRNWIFREATAQKLEAAQSRVAPNDVRRLESALSDWNDVRSARPH